MACKWFLIYSSALLISFSWANGTYDGYTFVFSENKAYLYGMDKQIVNQWTVPHTIAACADLLRDSSIIVPSQVWGVAGRDLLGIPLPGGRLQIIDWEGNVTWEYTYAGEDYIPHHDIEPVYRTNDPNEKPTILMVVATLWGDKIVEIRPKGNNDADIVWEWVASDHRCYEDCEDKAGLIDSTKSMYKRSMVADIMHTNNVSFNPVLDQIIINMKGFSEFIIVDHSTTIEEARGSSGGSYARGGEILYRWGNPETYGVRKSAFFKGQHGACWVPLVMPGTSDSIPNGGNFLAVDNENGRVVEIECPGKRNGVYPRTIRESFAPDDVFWSYTPENLESNEGSIQKLPNGNYLICSGGVGVKTFVYEVTSDKEIVWELSDFGYSMEACRYAYSYLGGNKTPVKSMNRSTGIKSVLSAKSIAGKLIVTVSSIIPHTRLSVISIDGKKLINSVEANSSTGWVLPYKLPAGMYCFRTEYEKKELWEKIYLQQ